MRKITFFLTLVFIYLSSISLAQFTKDDIVYWIGEGTNEVVFVVDFNDESENSSYAVGYRYENETSFADMLTAISIVDDRITINLGSSEYGTFLNDIIFDLDEDGVNEHEGLAGIPDPNTDYWSTWSGDSFNDLSANLGVSELLENNRWFACSFKFNENFEASMPDLPIPLIEPNTNNVNILNIKDIKIYPNPFCDKITIHNNLDLIKINIIDIYGKIIFQTFEINKKQDISIDCSILKSGVYFINLISKTQIISKKIIKK